jgi:hypothetical protein
MSGPTSHFVKEKEEVELGGSKEKQLKPFFRQGRWHSPVSGL